MIRIIALLALAPFAAAAAQDAPKAEPVCVRAEIVPGFEGVGQAQAGAPAIGKAVALTLTKAEASASARPFKPGTYRGEYVLKVAKAGDVRIALSSGAWIAVTKEKAEIESTTHGHGPACSGIAKIVTFPLQPGTYRLTLSEAKAAAIVVGIAAGA